MALTFHKIRKHLLRLVGVVSVLLFSFLLLAQASAQTLNDGIYTLEQVERGAPVFEEFCKECHTHEVTEVIFHTWNQEKLSSMYDTMSATMPQGNAGSLYLDDYTFALAYLLNLMGYPAGEQELSPYDGSMRDITIVSTSGE